MESGVVTVLCFFCTKEGIPQVIYMTFGTPSLEMCMLFKQCITRIDSATVTLTMGNSIFPTRYRLTGNIHFFCKFDQTIREIIH